MPTTGILVLGLLSFLLIRALVSHCPGCWSPKVTKTEEEIPDDDGDDDSTRTLVRIDCKSCRRSYARERRLEESVWPGEDWEVDYDHFWVGEWKDVTDNKKA